MRWTLLPDLTWWSLESVTRIRGVRSEWTLMLNWESVSPPTTASSLSSPVVATMTISRVHTTLCLGVVSSPPHTQPFVLIPIIGFFQLNHEYSRVKKEFEQQSQNVNEFVQFLSSQHISIISKLYCKLMFPKGWCYISSSSFILIWLCSWYILGLQFCVFNLL